MSTGAYVSGIYAILIYIPLKPYKIIYYKLYCYYFNCFVITTTLTVCLYILWHIYSASHTSLHNLLLIYFCHTRKVQTVSEISVKYYSI